jgi:hypothetical protein
MLDLLLIFGIPLGVGFAAGLLFPHVLIQAKATARPATLSTAEAARRTPVKSNFRDGAGRGIVGDVRSHPHHPPRGRAEVRQLRVFYWDDIPGRRPRPDLLTSEQALHNARTLAKSEQNKLEASEAALL